MAQIAVANPSLYMMPAWEEKTRGFGLNPAVAATLAERTPDRVVVEMPLRQDAHHLTNRVADLEAERMGLQRLVCDLLSKNENLRLKLLEVTSQTLWR
jgi:hypothetical protein